MNDHMSIFNKKKFITSEYLFHCDTFSPQLSCQKGRKCVKTFTEMEQCGLSAFRPFEFNQEANY
jgi:hypothetical protein